MQLLARHSLISAGRKVTMPLTEAAVVSLAIACAAGLDPAMLTGIAHHESGFDPTLIHTNVDGSRDVGLMQINERNFGWLGLNAQTALDPCQSMRAAAQLLQSYSRYNTGSPTAGFANGYVQRVVSAVADVRNSNGRSASTPESATPSSDPAWDVRATSGGTAFVYRTK
jgi:type IV secretion system protein VirB1